MTDSLSNSEIVVELAEQFIERYRNGDRPPLKEYAEKYPELAGEIRDVFPAMAMMENIALDEASLDAEHGGAPADEALQFDQLGDYRIIREVGRGGMGVVYEAEQVSLGRHVALKVLPKQLLADDQQKRRFEREAKAAARLHHTNIVPVFGVGAQDGMHYYVMQFIQGLGVDEVLDELKQMQQSSPSGTPATGVEFPASRRSDFSAADVARSLMRGSFQQTIITDDSTPDGEPVLATTIGLEQSRGVSPRTGLAQPGSLRDTTTGKLSDTFSKSGSISLPGQSQSDVVSKSQQKKLTYWQSVANMGVQIASALQYAHDQGIQHRDIKPSNLLLDLHGTVWVTDFGLAKTDDQQNITHTGDILGTLRYMPPEAFEGKSDARSDVYSLGLTLYELLALKPAFDEKDRNKLIKQVTTEEPPRLGRRNREVPRDLQTIVHKAVDRDPGRRYQSANELAEDLQRFVDDEPIKARRVSVLERFVRWSRRNKAITSLTGTVAALLVIGAIGSTVAAAYFRQVADKNEKLAGEKGRLAEDNNAKRIAAVQAQHNEEVARLDAESERAIAQQQRDKARQHLYVAHVQVAQRALELGNTGRMEQMLTRWLPRPKQPDRRSWEWYYLLQQAHRRLEVSLYGHTNLVRSVAWSPDGMRLASASADGTVRIWNLSKGNRSRILWRGKRQEAVAWSPDGRRLLSGDWNGVLRLWEAESGILLNSWTGHGGPIVSLAWRPDGRKFASASFDRTILIWDADGKSKPVVLRGHTNQVRDVAWSPDGKRLASAGHVDSIRIWDAETGRQLRVLPGRLNNAVAWSPDGKRLVAETGADPTPEFIIRMWNTESWEEIQKFRGHTGNVRALAWNADGTRLASGSSDDTVRIWDTSTGETLRVLRGHTDNVVSVAWHPDGKRLASSGWDYTIKIWDTDPAVTDSNILRGHGHTVRYVKWSPDGKRLVSASWDRTARIWDPVNRSTDVVLHGDTFWFDYVVWSPDGDRLASASWEKIVRVWDATTGKQLEPLTGHTDMVREVAWSPDGRYLASASRDKTIRIWDAKTGAPLKTLTGHTEGLLDVLAWSPDSRRIASATPRELKIWDVNREKEVVSLRVWYYGDRGSLAWSPDGKRLASSHNNLISVFDVRTGKGLQQFRGHAATVTQVVWSKDGKRLASSSYDKTIKIWDVTTGEELLTLHGHTKSVWSIDWSPDGHTLVSASADGTIRIWDAAEGYELGHDPAYIKGRTTGLLARARSLRQDGQLTKAADDLSEALRWKSNDARLLQERARLYVRLGRWKLADADFDKARRLDPNNSQIWGDSVPLRLGVGGVESYRRLCRQMVERFVEKKLDPNIVDVERRIAWTCLVGADAVDNPGQIQEFADRSFKRSPTSWYRQILKALAEYRAGRFRSALKTLPQVQRPRFETLVAIIRSMAHHKLGQTEQARQALRRALDLINEQQMKGDFGPDWWGWMYCRVLIREAETMIHGKSQE